MSMAATTTRVRGFVDLRSFARAPVPTGDYLTARRILPEPPGPVEISALALDHASGAISSLPGDEFLIVLTGRIDFATLDGAIALRAGQSAVLPRGMSFGWSVDTTCRAIVMRCSSGDAGAKAITVIDENAALEPSGAPLQELLIGPTPSCRNHTDYRSANGEFLCGTWDSTPYHRRAMPYRHYELMHLLHGAVTFEDEAGNRGTFSEGDIFLLEQGASCSWLSVVDVKKVYAIYRPA